MIDLHCHILPGVDDGAKDMEMTLAMAQEAANQGIDKILCTPHRLHYKYNVLGNTVIEKVAEAQAAIDEAGIPVELYEGNEVHLHPDIIEKVQENKLLFADLSQKYLLLEFPNNEIPIYANSIIQDLLFMGKTPIIVHPERNSKFIENPNLLYDYIEDGALIQLTAPSICGHYGKKVQKAALKMLDHNLGHMIASDAHNLDTRPFMMAEAFDIIDRKFGRDVSAHLEAAAEAVFNGEDVSIYEPMQVKTKFSLFSFN